MDGTIALSAGQIAAAIGALVAAITGMAGFVAHLVNKIQQANTARIAQMRDQMAMMERARAEDKQTIEALIKRVQTLEERNYTFMETQVLRQAQSSERIAGSLVHSNDVLDQLADLMRQLGGSPTGVHVAIKEKISEARKQAKHISGEHRVPESGP